MKSRNRRRICRTGFIVFWLLFIHQIGGWNGQESSRSWKWLGVQKTFAFDADAESGPNRHPEGATTIRQTQDSRWVIYDRQDQTDWLKVTPPDIADQQVIVMFDFLRLVGSVGVEVYGDNPYAPPLEQIEIDDVKAYNYRLTVLQEHYFKVYAKAEGAIAKYTFQYALTPVPPSATPLATPTVTPPPTPTIALTATPTVTPPPTPTIAPTATPTVTPTVTMSPTTTPSPLPTATPTTPPTPTATPTVAPTPTATLTPGPTASPTMSPTPQPSPTPTRPPVTPTFSPTMTPTVAVTVTPTPQPAGTALPALFATLTPLPPTPTPSPRPSPTPTASPSASPTSVPQLKVTVPPTTTAVPKLPGAQEFNWWLIGGLLLCVLIILALLVLVVLLKKRQSSSNTELPTITAADFRLLASLAADQHKVRLAEKCYRKATELEPYNTDTYYELGVFFYQTDQCKEAITAFKRYLTGKIIQPEAYFYLASCYVRLRQYDAAEEFFTKALQLKPDDALTYVGLGEVAQGRGNRQQAEEYYEQALALDPDCQEARQRLNRLG